MRRREKKVLGGRWVRLPPTREEGYAGDRSIGGGPRLLCLDNGVVASCSWSGHWTWDTNPSSLVAKTFHLELRLPSEHGCRDVDSRRLPAPADWPDLVAWVAEVLV